MIIINVFQNNQNALLHVLAGPTGVEITEDGELVPGSEDLHFMNLSTIRAATDDFTDSNKLGQGGTTKKIAIYDETFSTITKNHRKN